MSNSTRKYEELVERHLDVCLRSGDEFMCRCWLHEDRSASLQFNVKSGLWICFSCGEKGNAKTFMRQFGGTFREPEVEVADIYAKLDMLDALKTPVKPSVLPEATLKRYSFPTDYWDGRGLSRDIQKVFDLGYDPMEDEAIIPVRNPNGGLMGVIRRRLAMDDGPKYMYYKGFPRKASLFASWLVAKSDTDHVAITEGALDAVSVWQAGVPAVAQYGSSLSREQVVLLRRLGITKITLFYDDDKAGREAVWTAIPLLRDFLVYVVSYPESDRKQDPGDLSPKQIARLVAQAKLIL